MTDLLINSERLEFLPEPWQSLTADRGFDPNNEGARSKYSIGKREIYTIPFLLMFYASFQINSAVINQNKSQPWDESSQVWHDDAIILSGFFGHLPGIATRNYFTIFGLFFPIISGGSRIESLLSMTYFFDVLPMLAIWWIESFRRGNGFTIASYG